MDTHRSRACSVWFEHGQDAFHAPPHQRRFPPLDDRDAQRAWLSGFRTAWAYMRSPGPGADPRVRSAYHDLDSALLQALDGHGEVAATLFTLAPPFATAPRMH